jgi:hypothetical protein
MSSKKRIAAVVLTIAALSLGSVGVASADGKGGPKGENRAAHKVEHDAHHAAVEALVATTIGLDAATIKSRRVAGESLATIAGAKKGALIAALVAYKSTEIDARVAAGKMTAAQATTAKAELTVKVTARVESVKAPKPPKAPKPAKADKPKASRS